MPSQKELRRRITSTENTRKITKAMEMVAAARLRRSQQRIESARPYGHWMMEFIAGLFRYAPTAGTGLPLLEVHKRAETRGSGCRDSGPRFVGGFNSNVVRRTLELKRSYEAQGLD